ncbi:trichohyalin-like [Morone saxatilis]|uniref:trichohyalin-like n=1 Tax=Morone saxatilis TaxID=34816 RepID=UPI0015E1D335|nr:trichohyalin-like [Morone saxatilis]
MDGDHCSLMLSAEKTPSLQVEQDKAFKELKTENATLRSELRDAREELQKRLEDLEAQRRAEAEARTRLKQLSRKHASRSVEKEEQDKEWKAQLETEKAETERLRKAVADLESEIKRGREERENNEREEQEEDKNKALEDRESEMIELNIQLKKQLAEVKAQLALEREERKREEEEKNRITNTEIDVKKELNTKLEELQAELEELKRSRKEDSLEEDKLSVANSPLTYLTLHDDEFNSNVVCCNNKPIPSPEQHLLFCQSTNQRNMLVFQATEERTVIDPERLPPSDEGQAGRVASELEDNRQNYMVGCSLSDHKQVLSEVQKDEPAFSNLAKEVERLQKENAKETERANQYQVKLEALQSQVTRQTQQLTMAFENQSQHIAGLLAELQEKESALLSQGEELQRYKQELDALKAQKEGEEMTGTEGQDGEQKEEAQDERSVEISGLQLNQEKECAVSFLTKDSLADRGCNAERDAGEPEIVIFDAERPTVISDNDALWLGEQHSGSVHSDKTRSNHDSACVMGETEYGQSGGTADLVAELHALRQENQLLKQKMLNLTDSDTSPPVLHTDSEHQGGPGKQSRKTGSAALSCLVEQRSPIVRNDIPADAQQSPPQNVKTSEDEDLEREDRRTTRTEEELDLEAACQLQIDRLQQQVMELQMQLRALSKETEQQANELAMWRLASQPAPTFDLPHTDNQSETQNQSSAVRRSLSNQQQTDETQKPALALTVQAQIQAPDLSVEESTGNVTIVREDELLLSSSSSKLQGRMLFSRLQHRNLPEPKSLNPSKKTAALQEYSWDTSEIDMDSEKENQEINLFHESNTCQTQHKEKRDTEVLQMSSEKTGQQQITKDSQKVSGHKQTKRGECHMVNPEAKPDDSRATNEINTTSDSSDNDVRTEMKCVSSQTEECLFTHSAPTASELHCAYTQTEEHASGKELPVYGQLCPVYPDREPNQILASEL